MKPLPHSVSSWCMDWCQNNWWSITANTSARRVENTHFVCILQQHTLYEMKIVHFPQFFHVFVPTCWWVFRCLIFLLMQGIDWFLQGKDIPTISWREIDGRFPDVSIFWYGAYIVGIIITPCIQEMMKYLAFRFIANRGVFLKIEKVSFWLILAPQAPKSIKKTYFFNLRGVIVDWHGLVCYAAIVGMTFGVHKCFFSNHFLEHPF